MNTNTRISRRKFLRWSACGAAGMAGVAGLTAGYGFWEASQIRIRRETVALPHLPPAFVGKIIAVLADLHHGPYVGMGFIREAVAIAQSFDADAYALVGDFAHKGTHTKEQLPACLDALTTLKAPLGVFAVPGNHDMQNSGQVYRDAIRTTPITDVTNRSVRLKLGSDELWIAGVDDLWWGKPNLEAALQGVPTDAAVILMSHNPDYAEVSPDSRVGLMLSGHMHGGQAYIPGMGAAWLPSRYGDKYRAGLVQGPASTVYVSRGLGEAGVPLRLNCPPEINLLTLTTSS